jgi:hypothetical protein
MKFTKLMLMTALTLSFTSCGGKKIGDYFKSVDVATTGEEEVYVSTTVGLDLGEVDLPFASIDLPKNYGSVSIATFDGLSNVTVNVNLTEIAGLPGGIGVLPNGQPIPVEMTPGGVVQIDIPSISGRVYVSYTDEVAIVGIAFSLKQLDFLGELERVGVWVPLTIKNVNLLGGVYFDDTSAQNGIGFFADLKGIIPWKSTLAFSPSQNVEFKVPYVSRRNKRKVMKKLFQVLHGQPQTLELVRE